MYLFATVDESNALPPRAAHALQVHLHLAQTLAHPAYLWCVCVCVCV